MTTTTERNFDEIMREYRHQQVVKPVPVQETTTRVVRSSNEKFNQEVIRRESLPVTTTTDTVSVVVVETVSMDTVVIPVVESVIGDTVSPTSDVPTLSSIWDDCSSSEESVTVTVVETVPVSQELLEEWKAEAEAAAPSTETVSTEETETTDSGVTRVKKKK